MASLTDTLGSVSPSRRIIDPQNNKGPTFLQGLANLAANAVDGGSQAFRQAQASGRQAQADAAKASETGATNDAAGFALRLRQGLLEPRPVAGPDMTQDLPNNVPFDAELAGAPNLPGLEQSVSEIKRAQAAENQGRLPSGSAQITVEAQLSSLIARHPDNQEAIMKTLKEAGVDHALFREWETGQAVLDAERDAKLKGFQIAYDRATTAGLALPGLPVGEVAATGRQILQSEEAIKVAKDQADMARAEAAEGRAQSGFDQSQLDRVGANEYTTLQNSILSPIYNSISARITEAGAVDAEGNTRSLEQLLGEGTRGIDQVTMNLVGRAQADGMGPSVIDAIRQRGEDLKTSITQMWSGDGSQFKIRQQALTSIQTNLGLDAAAAMPVYTSLSGILGESAVNQLFQGNPAAFLPPGAMDKLKKELGSKISGVIDTPQEEATMTTVAGILRGELDINTITERQAVGSIPTLALAHEANARDVVAGGGNSRAYINSGINLANAAVELQPGADYQRFRQVPVAQNYLFQPSQLQADLKLARENPGQGGLLVAGKRAAATHTLTLGQNQQLSATEQSMGWRVTQRNGQYVVDLNRNVYDQWNRQRNTMANRMPVERGLGVGLNRSPNAGIPYDQARGRIPQVLKDQVWGMNLALTYLVETSSLDDDFAGASKSEARQFFVTQGAELPRSMQQRQTQSTEQQATYRQRDAQLRGVISNAVSASAQSTTEAIAARPRTQAASVGQEYLRGQGWSPQAVAGILGNLEAESGFNTTIPGDGGRAVGLAQWHPDRRAEATRQGFNLSDINDAYAFVNWELNNTEKAAGDRLKNARTAREAADIFAQYFLRPRGAQTGNPDNIHNISGRRRNAERHMTGN